MIPILSLIFLVFGLIIGSFLNVVVARYNTHKSFGGRSACMACENTLQWYELIPLFSFFVLRGRCRNCETRISWQYPLVELSVGIIFASLFWKFQSLFFASIPEFTITYAYYAIMFSLLVVIAVYDLRHKIIPDALSLIFGVLAFIGIFLFSSTGFYLHTPNTLEFFSGIIIAAPFALIWLVSRGTWMGLGDAKLALGLGYLLGLGRVLSSVVVAFWAGAIIGLLLIFFSGKHKMRSEIPFAPFLVLGAIIAFLFDLYLFPIGF